MARVGEKVRWIVFFALVFVVGVSWALASPIGSSPDDTFHVPSIWCSATARDGLCDDLGPAPDRDGYRLVRVAETIGDEMSCYRYNYFVSASCQPGPSATEVETLANDDLYPDGYYWIMGPFASSNVIQSVVLIRVINFALCVGLIATATWLATDEVRRVVPLGVVSTSVPMMLFLFSSNNPSGLLVASIVTTWIALSSGFRHVDSRRRRASFALGFVAVFLALVTRSDAGVYVLVTLFVVVLSVPKESMVPKVRNRLLVGVSVLALAGLVIASLSRYPGAGVFIGMKNEDFDRSLSGVVFENLRSVSLMWTGPFGDQPLGWLDTPVPQVTRFVMSSLFALLVVTSSMRSPTRARRPTYVIGLALFVIPMYFMALDRSFVGEGFQSRYLLPLLPLLLMSSLSGTNDSVNTVGRRVLVVGTILVSIANSFALHADIRRYVTGIEVFGLDLEHNSEWWWTWGPSANVTWVIGSLAFLGAGLALFAPPRVLVER